MGISVSRTGDFQMSAISDCHPGGRSPRRASAPTRHDSSGSGGAPLESSVKTRETWTMNLPAYRVVAAMPEDAAFLREMARHAATLEGRPLPAAEAEDVTELVPADVQDALVAVSTSGARLGGAWLLDGGMALVPTMLSAPEVCMALTSESRDRGVGTALLQAVISRAADHGHSALVLNVHLRNTAALRLYMKCGFRVAGAGRGRFGVAMACTLPPSRPHSAVGQPIPPFPRPPSLSVD